MPECLQEFLASRKLTFPVLNCDRNDTCDGDDDDDIGNDDDDNDDDDDSEDDDAEL